MIDLDYIEILTVSPCGNDPLYLKLWSNGEYEQHVIPFKFHSEYKGLTINTFDKINVRTCCDIMEINWNNLVFNVSPNDDIGYNHVRSDNNRIYEKCCSVYHGERRAISVYLK